MEKYNFLKSVVNASNNDLECDGCVFSESFGENAVVINNAFMQKIITQDITTQAQCMDIAYPKTAEDCPSGILAYYIQNENGVTRLTGYREGCFVLYLNQNTGYANITQRAVADYICSYIKGQKKHDVYICDDIYCSGVAYSKEISDVYREKYGETVLDKAALLFVSAKGSTRFRGRYYKILNELAVENFIIPIKDVAKGTLTAAVSYIEDDYKYLNNNNLNLMGSMCFDNAVLDVQNISADYLTVKRYVGATKLLNCKSAAVMPAPLNADFDLLKLRGDAERLFSLGIDRLVLSTKLVIEDAVYDAKIGYLKNYLSTLAAALTLGNSERPILAVYPTFSLCCADSLKDAAEHISDDIKMLETGGVFYCLCDENTFKTAELNTDKKIIIAGRQYDTVVLLHADNISFATANQMQAFASNGVKFMYTGNKPHLIDGVKSTRVTLIEKILKSASSIGGRFRFGNANTRVGMLPDKSLLCFEAGLADLQWESFKIKGNPSVYIVDLISNSETRLTNVCRRGMLSTKVDIKGLGCRSVLLHITKNKRKYNSNFKYNYCQTDGNFVLKSEQTDKNIFPLLGAVYRTGKGRWNDGTVIPSSSAKTELRFLFNAQDLNDTAICNIAFCSAAKVSAVAINGKVVSLDDNLSHHIKSGANEIRVMVDSLSNDVTGDRLAFLYGDFAVLCNSPIMCFDDQITTERSFTLAPMPDTVDINDLRNSGFWFFSGVMTLSCSISAQKSSGNIYKLGFKNLYADIAQIQVNGIPAATLGFESHEAVISDLLQNGENEITIKLYTASQFNINEDKISFTRFGATTDRREREYIELAGITKKYKGVAGEISALKDVSFTVGMGELVAITGTSGSGKTTLLNILAGITKPTQGAVYVDEKEVSAFTERQRAGYLSQFVGLANDSSPLNEKLNVRENILAATALCRDALSNELILNAISLTDRAEDYPYQLSSMQRLKLAIARAVAKNTPIIICDCGIDLLDNVDGKEILTLLKEACVMNGKTVFITTNRAQVCAACNRVIRLEDGCIIGDNQNEEPSTVEEIEWQ